MNTDTVKELPALLNELGVTVKAVRIDRPDNAPKWVTDIHASYRVSVRYQGRGTSLFFYCGSAVKGAPSVADVIYSLARDYDSSVYTLQEFGDEFGWSAETVQTFNAVKRNAVKFKRLFPADDVRLSIAECEY
jgi:hypothetical protein